MIVTGSSNGIGRTTARFFAAEGAKVTITGRSVEALKVRSYSADSLQEAHNELLSAGAAEDDVLEVIGDVTEATLQKELIDKTVTKFGRLDVLVQFFLFLLIAGEQRWRCKSSGNDEQGNREPRGAARLQPEPQLENVSSCLL